MLILLPVICWILLFLAFHRNTDDSRESILSASVIWGALLTFITEFLSIFNLISLNWIAGFWGLIILCLLYLYTRSNHQLRIPRLKAIFAKIKGAKISAFLLLLLLSVTLIITIIGLIAIVAPPNNWDSMDYHMSRVVHWIQDHNVADYPTDYTPQLYQNPWAEFAILHFQVLSGGDYFANLVQWFSMVGSVVGVSLIAKLLGEGSRNGDSQSLSNGVNTRSQVFAALVAATIPMGILQASSTQNDYVLAFWLVCFVYYVLLSVRGSKDISHWRHAFKLGASLGLALLTKGTSYFYLFPFLVWFCLSAFQRLRWQFWQPTLTMGFLAIALNISHYWRNYSLFGSPLGSPEDYKNSAFGLPVLLSNVIRNIALHIGTPVGLLSGYSNKLIHILHTFIGVDINDPRTTFSKTFYVPGGLSTIGIPGNENSAGNFIHLLLIGLAIIIFGLRKDFRKQRYAVIYLFATLATFLLFCYILKWQSWHSRLHLPFFVLSSVFIGLALSKIPKKAANAIAILLLLSALPWVFCNAYKPLIGSNNIFQISRIEQYFSDRPQLKKPYMEAAKFVASQGCANIGLSLGKDPWEYPWWVVLQKNKGKLAEVEHVNITNISAIKENQYPYGSFQPCAIISLETKRSQQKKTQEMVIKNHSYIRQWEGESVGVFLSKEHI